MAKQGTQMNETLRQLIVNILSIVITGLLAPVKFFKEKKL